jgi:hypothetical protein
MKYTIYNPVTGQIESHITASDPATAELNLNGCAFIEGHHNANLYYIDQGQLVSKLPQPAHEYHCFQFDWNTKTWILDLTQTAWTVRNLRNSLLLAIDRVNPVWYAGLTTEQQQELQTYRLALLAVPQQAGFPSQVEWPAKPVWL